MDKNLMKSLCIQTLKQMRLDAQITQAQLANMLGKPQSFVSKYENGDRSLEISEVYLICKELNKSLCDFEEILEWFFFDLFNYEIHQKLELKYTEFKGAYTFFENPLKPLFASILDNNYYLFINNSYT